MSTQAQTVGLHKLLVVLGSARTLLKTLTESTQTSLTFFKRFSTVSMLTRDPWAHSMRWLHQWSAVTRATPTLKEVPMIGTLKLRLPSLELQATEHVSRHRTTCQCSRTAKQRNLRESIRQELRWRSAPVRRIEVTSAIDWQERRPRMPRQAYNLLEWEA